MITLTLADLATETQRQIRQESQDFHYSIWKGDELAARLEALGIRDGEDVTVQMALGTEEENTRRASMVQFAVVTSASVWSANGGVGQAFCWFTVADDNLLGHWRALKWPGEWFDFLREVGL